MVPSCGCVGLQRTWHRSHRSFEPDWPARRPAPQATTSISQARGKFGTPSLLPVRGPFKAAWLNASAADGHQSGVTRDGRAVPDRTTAVRTYGTSRAGAGRLRSEAADRHLPQSRGVPQAPRPKENSSSRHHGRGRVVHHFGRTRVSLSSGRVVAPPPSTGPADSGQRLTDAARLSGIGLWAGRWKGLFGQSPRDGRRALH